MKEQIKIPEKELNNQSGAEFNTVVYKDAQGT